MLVDFVYQPVRDDSGQTRELLEQSRTVEEALDRANARIAELEAQVARQ